MSEMMSWFFLLPWFLAMALAAVLPGYFWVRMHVNSSWVCAAVSPGITIAVVTIASIVYNSVGLAWSGTTVLPLLFAVAAAGYCVYSWADLHKYTKSKPTAMSGKTGQPGVSSGGDHTFLSDVRTLFRRYHGAIWIMVAVGWVVAALPMFMHANPEDPAQQWDAVFHVNGIWGILHDGTAQPMGGLSHLFQGRSVFYPDAWHAFVALFSTPPSIIPVSNVSSIFLMAMWVLGATALTSVLTTSRVAVLAAPIAAGCMLSMPADALTAYVQWPHAMGVALSPGAAVLTILFGRRLAGAAGTSLKETLSLAPLLIFLVLSCVGMANAHPSAVFALWVLVLPGLLGGVCQFMIRQGRLHHWGRLFAGLVLAIASVGLPLKALTLPKVRSMGAYPRSGISWEYALSVFLTPFPPFSQTTGLKMTLGVTACTMLFGAYFVMSNRWRWWSKVRQAYRQRGSYGPVSSLSHVTRSPQVWIIVSFILFSLMTLLAYSPIDDLRTFLLAPWYMDPRRIMGSQNLTMIPLVACGFAQIIRCLQLLIHRVQPKRYTPSTLTNPWYVWKGTALVGIIVLALSYVGGLDSRLRASDSVYDGDQLGPAGMATKGELKMLRRMPETLPEDAYVIGDPVAGEAYSESIGQRWAYFPQLTYANEDSATQALFVYHFNEIHTNPEICQAIKDNGITHFYQDADGPYYSDTRSRMSPGFYNVDTSTGFKLVDSGGTAQLWEITACG